MRMRGLLMLAFALVVAIIAVVVARNWMQSRGSQPAVAQRAELATTTVVVARAKLDFAARLGPEHVQVIKWPAEAVPPGTFRTIEEVFPPGVERVVLRSVEAGEPIFAVKISGAGQRATLSAIVDKDMRALTIRVNDVTQVAGFVLPGDRVDIMLNRDEGGGGQSLINDVLLQNIRVLGVDQLASDRADKPVLVKAVTLEVTPLQAQKITLAAQVGILTLALRNEADSDPSHHRTIRVADLRGGEMVRPLAAEPPSTGTGGKSGVRVAGDSSAVISVTSIKIVRAMKPATQDGVVKEKPELVTKTGAAKARTVRPSDLKTELDLGGAAPRKTPRLAADGSGAAR
jgi:pilus assembly protein CpaB